jgi:GTPase SAR1 family protein
MKIDIEKVKGFNNRVQDKLTIVPFGDDDVGKSSLISRIKNKKFEETKINELLQYTEVLKISIENVSSQDYYVVIREDKEIKTKDKIHIFLLCFDLTNKDSFYNVSFKYYDEMKELQKDTSIGILVGTKSDSKPEDILITDQEALDLTKKLKLKNFIKISSKTDENISELMKSCLTSYFINKYSKKKKEKISRFSLGFNS